MCCLAVFYFNLLVGSLVRKGCLKLTVYLVAGTMLELLLKTKGVKGAQNQLFNSKSSRHEDITHNFQWKAYLSFEGLGSVPGAPMKLANHSDIQKSEMCREFCFSYYSD